MHADLCLAVTVVSCQACNTTDPKLNHAKVHGLHNKSLGLFASAYRLPSFCHFPSFQRYLCRDDENACCDGPLHPRAFAASFILIPETPCSCSCRFCCMCCVYCLTCIAFDMQVTEGLTKDLQELSADRRRLQRDLDIKSEVEQQMAIRGALQVGADVAHLPEVISCSALPLLMMWHLRRLRSVVNVCVGSEPERRHGANGISGRQHSSHTVIL